MSGIARLLIARGIAVSGSDLKDSPALGELRALGANISVGHARAQLGDPDSVVVSSAIPPDNPERAEARERGLRILARAQMLAALASGRTTLAVAGTHGKTTTTSMLSVILERAGLDPSYVIGGHLNESGSGAHHGTGQIFVAEADESDGSFLLLRPEVGVITNVEADHVDFYSGGLPEIEAAFAQFVEGSGYVVACGDDPGACRAIDGTRVEVVTYGAGASCSVRVEFDPTRVRSNDDGWSGGRTSGAKGSLILEEGERVDLTLRVPGAHNLLNAAAALLAARRVGVAAPAAADALATFSGVHRRFEARGEVRGIVFYDDYAHHPTELRATLSAAAQLPGARVIAVFQPHRYSRTKHLWRELGESLAAADLVVVTDVYGAGEEPIPGITGRLLVDSLRTAAPDVPVVYLPHRSEVAPFLASEARAGDVILTLGAGDITVVADEVIERMDGVS
jgi:UDP-N-acetylmuramate--alanine ligase